MDTGTFGRPYLRTHPWLTFSLDIQRCGPTIWLLLGEAKSKCEHMSGIALAPQVAKLLYSLALAKGVLATTAIEGNTLTEEQVLQHLEGKLKLPPSKEYLQREIDNIIKACNSIGQRVLKEGSTPISVERLRSYNIQILDGLDLADGIVSGEIPTQSIGVGRYRAAPREDCPYLLERLCEWLNTGFTPAKPEERIILGALKAIMAHLYIAWIHPFGDGNGRLARLLEFEILLTAGAPSTAAHLLSNHYNQTRAEYYRQLDAASGSGGDMIPFVTYALQGFVDGLRGHIEYIKMQQLVVHWINHVHERFRGETTRAGHRRRQLILDLAAKPAPVPLPDMRHVTPRLAELYAKKTDKTVRRDVNALEQMGLVVRTAQGFRAKLEIMNAFLPDTLPPDESTKSTA